MDKEPSGLRSMGSQRVGGDWATNTFHFQTKLPICSKTGDEIVAMSNYSLVRMSPITWRLLLKAFSGNADMLEFGLHAFCFKMHRLKLVRLTLNVWTCLFYAHQSKYPFEFWYLDMKQSGKAEKGKHIKPYI